MTTHIRHLSVLTAVLLLAGCSDDVRRIIDDEPPGSNEGPSDEVKQPSCSPPPIDRFKELAIVDPSVVDDPVRTGPGGAWSFKHLMDSMRPEGVDAPTFVQTWLEQWNTDAVINGFAAPAKTAGMTALLAEWPKTADGKLDLDRAPLKLLALTNRVDLRNKNRVDSAGEGRLVFSVTRGTAAASFTVIFEYLLPTHDGSDAITWATRWHELGAVPFGERFNAALEGITRTFTDHGAAPARVNGSSIGQVRTNEILLGSPWELREFRLDDTGVLRMAPTLQCPDQTFNGDNPTLTQFILDNEVAVRRGAHVVPQEMLGGVSPETPEGAWKVAGVDEELRHAFALQTCNGCHNGETRQRDGFFHVSPVGVGAGRLSAFMHDPESPTNDELARRAGELSLLLCNVSQDHNPPSAGPGNEPTPE